MQFEIDVGNVKDDVFDNDDVVAGSCPVPGTIFWSTEYQAFFRFLQNREAATAITEELACVASGDDRGANGVHVAAATGALQNFAAVRVPGAASMAGGASFTGQWGWFQVTGLATFLCSGGTAIVADTGVVTSGTVAGKIEGVASDVASALGTFGVATEAATVLDTEVPVSITRSVFQP